MIKAILLLLAVAIASSFLIAADTCPHDVEVTCIDDINKGRNWIYLAYPVCDKAAKEKGKDLPADLECMKYFTSIEKDCWPCICLVA